MWGIRDFEHRFGRKPEGMWLPEDRRGHGNAGDSGRARDSLHDSCAPRQAKRVRRIGSRRWNDVSGRRIDPTPGLPCESAFGPKSIVLFFYDGPISQGGGLREVFSIEARISPTGCVGGFSDDRTWPQLVAHRNRWRNLRPPSRARRNGSLLRPALSSRSQQARRADQLRPISWKSIRPTTKSRSSKTPRGAASTESNAGVRIAAAIPATHGLESGMARALCVQALRLACETPWPP